LLIWLLLLSRCKPLVVVLLVGLSTGLVSGFRSQCPPIRPPLRSQSTNPSPLRLHFMHTHPLICNPFHKHSFLPSPSRPSTALAARMGRAVYQHNYDGRSVTQAKIIGIGIMDYCLDPRMFNRVSYLVSVVMFVVLAVTRKLWRSLGGQLMQLLRRQMGKNSGARTQEEELEIFECEKCRHQLRPAKDRAKQIFKSNTFRCPRCGSKATAFFNIANMKDSRAMQRLKRIQMETDKRMAERSLEDAINDEGDD
jgi:DNA-directed RNA polymerase subunit RPC12/RpoP